MCWAEISEVIKAIAPVFTAGAACAGAYIGYRGLEKWRAETAGKRQADLAEQVLVNFYAARDTLRWVRTSGFLPSEGQSRVADDTEPEQIRIMKNTYFIPIERLNREKELFSKLHAQRYSFMAIFGGTKIKSFETIFKVHSQLSATAHQLIQIAVHDGASISVSTVREKLLNDLGWGTAARPDDADKAIDAAVSEIEAFCKPILEGRKP